MEYDFSGKLIRSAQASLFRSNEQIQQEVEESLSLNDVVAAHNLQVIVDSGIVTLRGDIPDEESRDEADRVALEVSGVLAVRNELEISE